MFFASSGLRDITRSAARSLQSDALPLCHTEDRSFTPGP